MPGFAPEPWQVPTMGGAQRPMSVQVNTILPSDASQTDAAVLNQVATQIIEGHGNSIHRFVAGNRQQHSLSGRAVGTRRITMEGMEAKWGINNGLESLHLTVHPLGGVGGVERDIETNLDGYLCWVHVDPGFPDIDNRNISDAPGPYILAMNGYIIEPAFEVTSQCIGYPILFGKTALLCGSYVGDFEKLNPLMTNAALKRPNVTVPPNGWGKYAASTALDGTPLPPIVKTLGYWLFDWYNIHNLFQYLLISDFPSNWKSRWRSTNETVVQPVLKHGMYFASSQDGKSPLKPKGQNSIAAIPASQFAQQIEIYNLFYGEFYSRGKYRVATQSWTLPVRPGRAVAINDSPLMFMKGHYVYDYSGDDGGGINFSLDHRDTDPAGTPLPIGNNGDGSASALTADQYASINTWAAAVVAAKAAQNAINQAAISVALDVWNAKWGQADNKKLLNEAYNVEFLLTEMTDSQGNLIWQDGPLVIYGDGGNYTGPIQQYWFFWDNPFLGGPMFQEPLYFGTYDVVPLVFENTMLDPGPGNTTANGNTTMTYAQFYAWAKVYALTDAIKQRRDDYDAIFANLPQPVLPPFPTIVGGDISVFAHSNISINGTSWSYSQNPGS